MLQHWWITSSCTLPGSSVENSSAMPADENLIDLPHQIQDEVELFFKGLPVRGGGLSEVLNFGETDRWCRLTSLPRKICEGLHKEE